MVVRQQPVHVFLAFEYLGDRFRYFTEKAWSFPTWSKRINLIVFVISGIEPTSIAGFRLSFWHSFVHVVQYLADDDLLQLRNEDFGQLACIDVPEEVICSDFSCLSFKEYFDDVQGGLVFDNDVANCIFLKLDAINERLKS